MSDPNYYPPGTIPTFWQTFLHSVAQKVLTTVAVSLASYGLFAAGSSQETQFITVGAGVAVWLAGWGWTWLRTKIDTNRTVALAYAEPPAMAPQPVSKGGT